VSTVGVRDPRSDRVLIVLVYPDNDSAHMAPVRTEAAGGPELVPGYGPGVWLDNIAVVQSNVGELNRRHEADLDCDMGRVAAESISRPKAEDDDVVTALSGADRVDL
jgi:hypothetical protein